MEPQYNWPEIRMAYTIGWSQENGQHVLPTLADLSNKYGVGLSTLTHRAGREDWSRLRKEAQARIYTDAIKRFEGELAEKLSRCDKLAIDTALLVMQEAHDAIADCTLERDERLKLASKYLRLIDEALSLVHRGYGVEIEMSRLQELQEQIENDPYWKHWQPQALRTGAVA